MADELIHSGTQLPALYNGTTTLVDAHLAAGRADKTAYIVLEDPARRITYRDLAGAVCRVGHGLRRLGIRMEDRVLLCLLDSPEFVFGFLGAMRIGAVPIPTNTQLRPAEYEYMLNDSRARAAIVSSDLVDKIREIRGRLKWLEHVVVAPGPADRGELALDDLMAGQPDDLPPAETSRDDPAFWLYSSGSTGFPKGCVHLHHDMVIAADCFGRRCLGLREVDLIFSVPKLFFAYGLGNSLYFPLRVGATTLLQPGRFDAARTLEILHGRRPTVFIAVPTAFAAMLQVEDLGRAYDLSGIRVCHSGGEPLPLPIFERWKARFGVEILDGIGSSEVVHIYISNFPGRNRPGSTGEAVPGYEFRVVDQDLRDLPAGEVGDLLVKGDSTAAGYWNKHEQTKRAFMGSWFFSGDRLSRDADGFYLFAGRSDDMFKVSGQWVAPAEVESAVTSHPAVVESAAVARQDEDGLLKVAAYVVLRAGTTPGEPLAEEIRSWVQQRIAPFKAPRWIEFVADLPKTATGKIQRFKLRAEGMAGPGPHEKPREERAGHVRGAG